jgi:hypothetical protein
VKTPVGSLDVTKSPNVKSPLRSWSATITTSSKYPSTPTPAAPPLMLILVGLPLREKEETAL